ncbi:hypothetical protein EDB86DRAFT_2826625 [Lactarius hatsudake]|nr:hypothetical protein EDB86DRAFT_2826625 [Lactarius hatsudake]
MADASASLANIEPVSKRRWHCFGTNRPSWMPGARTTKIWLESGWHAIHEFAMPGKSKDDENGTLDFAGGPNTPNPGVQRNDDRSLFHTTSAPLSSKSYNVLSSDPGGQTTFLLGHISQQLAIFALNHTSIPPKQHPAYPSLSIIRVRLLWPRCLALSILRWTRH